MITIDNFCENCGKIKKQKMYHDGDTVWCFACAHTNGDITDEEFERYTKKPKKFKKKTNYENVKLLLEEFKMPFEEGVNDKVHPYIFISFDKKGKATDPY